MTDRRAGHAKSEIPATYPPFREVSDLFRSVPQPTHTCQYCDRGIRQDPFAFVEMYVDTEFQELCDSPRARRLRCPDCAGTGDDPDVPDYEYCHYCKGEKVLPFHWPASVSPPPWGAS